MIARGLITSRAEVYIALMAEVYIAFRGAEV
jgi:hypothetical protein